MTATAASLRDLNRAVTGTIIQAGEPEYDSARRIYNGMIQRRPDAIVRCSGVEDVVEAVNFARSNAVPVSVRGGGHSIAGHCVRDGGLVIELSKMQQVWVEPGTRTARVEGGTLLGQLDQATQAFGLATTMGTAPTTGVAGLTLGGGLGWLMRSCGLACDNLLSAEVVTADGRRLKASALENEELFWALRGGGGNFGVVTSLEFRLHPVDTVTGGMVLYPLARARDVLRFYREFAQRAPDELTTYAGLLTTPDGPVVALIVCYNGPAGRADDVLGPLRAFGAPIADTIGPVAYATGQQTMFDAAYPHGVQNYWKSGFLDELSDGLIDLLPDLFSRVPSPMTVVAIEQLGGAIARVGNDDTAFAHRDAAFNIMVTSLCDDPRATEANMAWTREWWQAVMSSTRGVYMNYMSEGEDERAAAAFGENVRRLAAIKRRYDPDNFFRANVNVAPALG